MWRRSRLRFHGRLPVLALPDEACGAATVELDARPGDWWCRVSESVDRPEAQARPAGAGAEIGTDAGGAPSAGAGATGGGVFFDAVGGGVDDRVTLTDPDWRPLRTGGQWRALAEALGDPGAAWASGGFGDGDLLDLLIG